MKWHKYPETGPKEGADCIVLRKGGSVTRTQKDAVWQGGFRDAGGDPVHRGGCSVPDVTHWTLFKGPSTP